MSYLPYEPPPPYSEYPEPDVYSPPPVHGAFAYVPVPVMLPVYQTPPPPPNPVPQQQLTYVTNYIYQQPSQSNPITDKGLIEWVPATDSNFTELTYKAVEVGSNTWDNSPFWVIRAHHAGELIPGKLAVNHRGAYVQHEGKEVPVHDFEVLCAPSHEVCWLPSNDGQVPPGAIAAGYTHNGEPLYIGRGRHLHTVTPAPGKVHPSHGCCYVSIEGSEIAHKNYDVLCRIVI